VLAETQMECGRVEVDLCRQCGAQSGSIVRHPVTITCAQGVFGIVAVPAEAAGVDAIKERIHVIGAINKCRNRGVRIPDIISDEHVDDQIVDIEISRIGWIGGPVWIEPHRAPVIVRIATRKALRDG